jgi:hypothetical protein
MKTLTQKFNSLNKKYLALQVRQTKAARTNNEDVYENLCYEMDIVQQKMSEIATKMEESEKR